MILIVFVSAINLSDNQFTLINQTEIAHFEILTEAQADNLIKIDRQLVSLAKMRNPVDFEGELNQLIQALTHQQVAHLRTTRNFGSQLQRPVMIFLI